MRTFRRAKVEQARTQLLVLPFQEVVTVFFMWCVIVGAQATHASIFDKPLAPERWCKEDFLRRLDVAPERLEELFAADAREFAAGR